MSRTYKQMHARAAHAARRAAGPYTPDRPEVGERWAEIKREFWPHAHIPRYGVTRAYWAGCKVKQRRIDRAKAKETMRIEDNIMGV
jgi:hypothetical protein